MKTKKKTKKNAKKTPLLRRYWDRLKDRVEKLVLWLEWNTDTLWSVGLVAFGLAMLCPSVMPWTVIAWGALAVGSLRLLLDLKNRWL